MPPLNASLRLTHYLENNQALPSHEDLLPNLEAEREQHRVDLQAMERLEGDEEVALGWRSDAQKQVECSSTCRKDLGISTSTATGTITASNTIGTAISTTTASITSTRSAMSTAKVATATA